jgi:hypothetical protein
MWYSFYKILFPLSLKFLLHACLLYIGHDVIVQYVHAFFVTLIGIYLSRRRLIGKATFERIL